MNLLELCDEQIVEKTNLSRKLTIGGKTAAYPVYRIRLDQLFYNDQNDRIATWITQYRNETGNVPLPELSREAYNDIIERFIIDSNPSAIEKTKNNIALVNQREPGVVLADGRIIDGNRRFTCLRLLQKEDRVIRYMEAVILDTSTKTDQKQIKMLELAIQHGEEQRVDYNQIDMAIGAYHDIVETGLLTIDEYASTTNIPLNEVRRKIETAKLIIELLEFMGVDKQYHIAREMEVYSLLYELVPLLKRCETEESKQKLKRSVFSNAMMKSFSDQRKYIRNVKAMMDSGMYASYIKKQSQIADELEKQKNTQPITNKKELDTFVRKHEDIAEDLQISMDRSLRQSKKAQTRAKPAQIVSKSLSMLMDIDTRILDKLSDGEKDKLQTQLHKLTDAVSLIQSDVADETGKAEVNAAKSLNEAEKKPTQLLLAKRKKEDPCICCEEVAAITNLNFTLFFSLIQATKQQKDTADCWVYFIDKNGTALCPRQQLHLDAREKGKVFFSLNSSASSLDKCYLVIQARENGDNEAQQLLEFPIKISFRVEFDF